MIFLFLTVISSVLVSMILKLNESREGNRFVVAGTNYAVATLLAFFFLEVDRFDIGMGWSLFGTLAGVGFVAGFLVLMRGMKAIGIAIPTSAARLSMLIPVTLSIIVFNEHPTPLKIAGLTCGIAAFVMLGLAQRRGNDLSTFDMKSVWILVGLFCIIGSTDFSMKYAQSNGVDMNVFMFFIFLSATIICSAIVLVRRHPLRSADIATGVILGIPNYFSVYFLLAALRTLDASAVFPAVSAAAVVLITLVGVIFWKEYPNRAAWIGIVLAAIAVALLGADN